MKERKVSANSSCLLIYGIFKKYNDFTPKMNAQRGEVCEHV